MSAPAAAIFVDAGWLLAAAGLLVSGTRRRDELACNYSGLLQALTRYVDLHSGGMRRLRTYWYDAAAGGLPSHDHNRIASLPYVTVRLGRLSRAGQQKGVDFLIYRDLMKLAQERAISRIYLLAGDEDLREGVVEAKERGVQVVLLGMPVEEGQNQSARLVRECDEYTVLPADVWREHFARRAAGEDPDDETVAAARKLGRTFARQWAQRVADAEVQEVLSSFPTVPARLSAEMLAFAERDLGSLRQRPDLKQEVRGQFWFELRAAAGGGEGDAASEDR